MTSEPWIPLLLAASEVFSYVLVSATVVARYTDRGPPLLALFRPPVAKRPRWFVAIEILIGAFFLVPGELVMWDFLVSPGHHTVTRIVVVAQFAALGLWTLYLIRLMRRPAGET